MAEELRSLKERLSDPALAALNTTEFDGRSVSLGELRTAADAAPFLAARRLVVVTGLLTRLAARGGDVPDDGEESASTSLKEFREALADYLPSAPPSTALVFMEPKALSERNRFLGLAERSEAGYSKRFDPPTGPEVVRWIGRRARAAGGEFTAEGAQALATAAGDEMRLIDNEIAKLLDYVDRARPVDLTDVEMLTPYAGEVTTFQMVDAMGQRQARAAVGYLHRLLAQPSQTPLAVFGMVARQFRLLLIARELQAENTPMPEVARALGLPAFVAGKLADQARQFSLTDLESIFRRLLEMDLAIKSSQIDGGLALETFVADPLG